MRLNKIIILLLVLSQISCDNELDTIVIEKPTPIVYGIISPQDSIHQIKLERSFICRDNIDWYAHKKDSIYFMDAQVFLETRAPTGDIIQRAELEMVEIPEKDPGLFISHPNLIYQVYNKELIDPGHKLENLRYVLTIHIPEIEEAIIAESIVPPLPPEASIKPTPNAKPFALQLFSREPIKFTWQRSLNYYLEFETRVNFMERRDDDWTQKSVSHYRRFNHWTKENLKDREEKIIIDDEWFYPMIGGKIKDDPEVNLRKFISIDFILKTSDPLFFDYFANNTYITDLSANIFTNIVNGLGIFAAYNRISWEGYTLDALSLNSLSQGKYTKHLKFSKW